MSPQVVLLTAISSLAANKLWAGLTLLGIVIGVAAVISLLSIGRALRTPSPIVSSPWAPICSLSAREMFPRGACSAAREVRQL